MQVTLLRLWVVPSPLCLAVPELAEAHTPLHLRAPALFVPRVHLRVADGSGSELDLQAVS